MPPQQRSMQRIAAVPGAVNLAVSELRGDNILSVANGGPVSAQTTLDEMRDYFGAGISVLAYGAAGDGTTDDRQAFVDSDKAGDNNYVPEGTYLIGSDLTLTHQVTFQEGAFLKPSSGATITLNGAVVAGLWKIFDLSAGGSIVLNNVSGVQARWFGARPSATGAVNSAAINAAILCAKASQNADLLLGPGTLEISASLNYAGANEGITTIGIIDNTGSQGSAPGASVLKWTGGASPMIEVTDTFNTFHGFSLQNNGSATHGIRCSTGGRQWVERVHFSCPNGATAFSVTSIEISGVNYDRIRLCDFEAGPAVKVLGDGTSLLIEQFMMDSAVGSGAFVDVRGSLDVLTLREGTVNYQVAIRTFIDMSAIGSGRVSVCRVTGNEFDGNVIAAQQTVATVKNCDEFVFTENQVSGFGNSEDTESPITATDSRVTIRNNACSSINQPLVRTLDATSFVYAYEANMTLTNTSGLIESSSQSGNLITALVSNTDDAVTIQGDRASAMAFSVHEARLTDAGKNYTIDIARLSDSFDQGYMTKGQVFTLVIFNNSGGALGNLLFNGTRFTLAGAAPTAPANGAWLSMTFYWTGATARELYRQ